MSLKRTGGLLLRHNPRVAVLVPVLGLAIVAGCDETTTEPVTTDTAVFSLDASTDWVYVDLADQPSVVTVADPAASTDWDIAFNATAVKLNGGESGAGSVAGYCLCANAGATPEAIMAMTAAGELGAFEGVTGAAIPGPSAWIPDSAEPGGVFKRSPWYRYDLDGQHTIFPTYDVYLIRTGSEVYKLQIIGYYDAAGKARYITFRSAGIDA